MPEMQEMWIWSLGQKDPLEKDMETHSSILAWEISWTEEPGKLQSMRSQRVRHDWEHMQCNAQLCLSSIVTGQDHLTEAKCFNKNW